jgi:hypothetical protein
MERRLYSPPQKPPIIEEALRAGHAETVPEALFNQHYIDEGQLKENIIAMLMTMEQVTLRELSVCYPFEKGLSEIIAYAVIAGKNADAVIDTSKEEIIEYQDRDSIKKIRIPLVIFTR